MTVLPEGILRATDLDAEQALSRLRTNIGRLIPGWEDFSLASPENLILEATVRYGDVIRATMENRFRQVYWATLRDRLAAIRKGLKDGFTLRGGTAAQVDGYFITVGGAAPAARIPIDAGTRVQVQVASETIIYQVLAATSIETTSPQSATVTLEHSETNSETRQSPEEANWRALIRSSPYIDETMQVSADNGDYAEVKTFLGQGPTDRVFIVIVDDQGRPQVRFGDGIAGAIPIGEVDFTWKTGGGKSGEVAANTDWTVISTIKDEGGNVQQVLFINPEESTAALDPMTVAQARRLAPLVARTQQRIVEPSDAEAVATNVPGIARALAASSDTDDTISEDHGIIELVGYGEELTSGKFAPAAPTAAQIAAVQAAAAQASDKYPSLMNVTLTFKAADFDDFTIVARVELEAGADAETAGEAARDAVKDFFAVANADLSPNESVDFGLRLTDSDGNPDYTISWSKLNAAIVAATGIKSIPRTGNGLLVNGVEADLKLSRRGFPRLAAVSILNAATGVVL